MNWIGRVHGVGRVGCVAWTRWGGLVSGWNHWTDWIGLDVPERSRLDGLCLTFACKWFGLYGLPLVGFDWAGELGGLGLVGLGGLDVIGWIVVVWFWVGL